MAWNNYHATNKYRNQKCEIDGIIFDSKKEANRYNELKLLVRTGEISDLQRQVKYVLIPQYRETILDKKGNPKPGKVIERECDYIADFVYKDKDGNMIVEDTKGFRTTDYKIKRKLMLHVHNVRIQEV